MSLDAEIIALDSDSDDDDIVQNPVSLKSATMVESSCSSNIVAEPVGCAPAIRTYVRPKPGNSSVRTAPELFVTSSPIVYATAPCIDLPFSTDSSTSSDEIEIQRQTFESQSILNIDGSSDGMEVGGIDDEVVGADENTNVGKESLICSVPISAFKQVRFAVPNIRNNRSQSVDTDKQIVDHPTKSKKTRCNINIRRKSTFDQSSTSLPSVFERFDYRRPAQQNRTGTDDQISLSIGGCPELRSCSGDVICSSGFISPSPSLLRPHSVRDNNLCKQIDCVIKSSETETRDDLKVTHTGPVILNTSDGIAVDDNVRANSKPIDPKITNDSNEMSHYKHKSAMNSISSSINNELKSIVELSIVNNDSGVDVISDYEEPPVGESIINSVELLEQPILETSITAHSALEDGYINNEKVPPEIFLPNPELPETLIANENVEEALTISDLSVHKDDFPAILQPELTQEEDALLNTDDDSSLSAENDIDIKSPHLVLEGIETLSISSHVIDITSIKGKLEEANTHATDDSATKISFPIGTDLTEASYATEDLATEGLPYRVDQKNEDIESQSVNVEMVSIDSTVKENVPRTEENLDILQDFMFDDYMPVNTFSSKYQPYIRRTALETLAEAALNPPSSIEAITFNNVSTDMNFEFFKPVVDIIEQQMEKIHSSSPATVENIPAENIPSPVNAEIAHMENVDATPMISPSKIHRKRRRSERPHYTVDRTAETIVRIRKLPNKGHSKRRVSIAAEPLTISEPAGVDQSRPDYHPYSQTETSVEQLHPFNDQSLPSFSDKEYQQHIDRDRYFDSGSPSHQLLDLTNICATDDALPSIEDLDAWQMDTYNMLSPSSRKLYTNSLPNNCLSNNQPTTLTNHRLWHRDSTYRSNSLSPSEVANSYYDPNLLQTNEIPKNFEGLVRQTEGRSTVENEHDSKQSTLQLPIKKRVIPLPGTPVRPEQSYYDPFLYGVSYGDFVLYPRVYRGVEKYTNYPAHPMLSIANVLDPTRDKFPSVQPIQTTPHRIIDRSCNYPSNQANVHHVGIGGGNYMMPPNEFHPNQAAHYHYDNPATSVDSAVKQDSIFMGSTNSHSNLPSSHPHLLGMPYKGAATDQSHFVQNNSNVDEFPATFQAEITSSNPSFGSNTNVNAVQTSPMHQQPTYQAATTPQRPPPPIPDTIQVTQTFHANSFRSATTQDMLSINFQVQDYSVSREQVFNLWSNRFASGERGENSAMPSPTPTNCSSPPSRKRKGKQISSIANPHKRAKHEADPLDSHGQPAIPPTKVGRKVTNSCCNGRITRSSNRAFQEDCVDSAEPSKKKGHSSKINRK